MRSPEKLAVAHKQGNPERGAGRWPQGCIKLGLANATKAPGSVAGAMFLSSSSSSSLIVIERPEVKHDYEDEDDEEDDSEKAADWPGIIGQLRLLHAAPANRRSREPQPPSNEGSGFALRLPAGRRNVGNIRENQTPAERVAAWYEN